MIGLDDDGVTLKVWPKSLGGSDKGRGHFLDKLVSFFRVTQDATDEIYRLLCFPFFLHESGAYSFVNYREVEK